ncbi:MAG: aminotransferase class V-fold PLP-dependent enzyme [Planctomycetaceae bacterium]|nr:aminotransferase class V-fold PLP-dependent enzyme [Planctomycetaceae bacterium]
MSAAVESVYLNHAGTSWPKPQLVQQAVAKAADMPPHEWAAAFDRCTENTAEFFQVPKDRLLITSGGTAALTLAMDELPWAAGDRILSTQFEHHAVSRHLVKLSQRGVTVDTVASTEESLVDLADLEGRLQTNPVKLVAMTTACNVTGRLLPTERVIKLAHEHGALVLLDASQTVGWTETNLTKMGADLVAFAGHKALHAPWGVGGLYVAPHVNLQCPSAACSITAGGGFQASASGMPGYCDAGSVNMTALAGLSAACDWLRGEASTDRLQKGQAMAVALMNQLRECPDVYVYHAGPAHTRVPTVAFRSERHSAEQLQTLFTQHRITASIGYQCAPWAHEALGTADTGVARVSFGSDTPATAIDRLLEVLNEPAC